MITRLLGCVLCRLADQGGWILVGVSSCSFVVSMLVEGSKGTVCSTEAECSAFLFHVAKASGMSMGVQFLPVDAGCPTGVL
ncbi:hypothetical protein V6N13_148578 [Hibiscus sabdariffa]